MIVLENVFYMPVSVTVTPNPVEVSVVVIIAPPVFLYKYIIVMTFKLMHRFLMFHFMWRVRWRGFRFWGSFCAGQTHDAGQGYYS